MVYNFFRLLFPILCLLVFNPVRAFCSSEYIDINKEHICANTPLSAEQYENAKRIIKDLHKETPKQFLHNYGPFLAAIYDKDGRLIAKAQNSVIPRTDCTNHAEINTIRLAQKKLKTYDLSSHDLSIYITAEPCIMCAGAIMWSGIKNVYFSVYSKDVERITGFDEGYKPDWINEFKKRNINVYGGIEEDLGQKILEEYVKEGKKIYKPERNN